MTLRTIMTAAALIAATTLPALADDMAETMKAMELGQVIGSEAYCGLTYDQAAIEAWIEKNVSPDNMGFAGELEMATSAEKYSQNDRGDSQKTAHCAAIRRTAKHFGFVKE